MMIKSMDLAWIVVNDIKKAIQYYTHTIGLKLQTYDEKYNWAELVSHQGNFRLGIAQKSDHEAIQPGQNAILTLTVDNLEKALADLSKKGAKMKGDVMEVPGNVKLQMMVDHDGNHFQIVEVLR